MIRVEGISVVRAAPGRAPFLALQGVGFNLEAGQLMLLLGRPGAGKSTLLEVLCGLLPLAAGRISVDLREGEWSWGPAEAAPRGVRRRVGLLFQYPERQIFGHTALEDVSWGLGVGSDAAAGQALDRVEIPETLRCAPLGRLSRGEKRRVALAGILARSPSVLLLDEPNVGLDPQGRDLLWQEIEAYRHERGAPVVVATHWPQALLARADRVLCLEAGRISLLGAPGEFLAAARGKADLARFLSLEERLQIALEGVGRGRGRPAWADSARAWLAESEPLGRPPSPGDA